MFTLFTFYNKIQRRSTVLRVPLQLVFPVESTATVPPPLFNTIKTIVNIKGVPHSKGCHDIQHNYSQPRELVCDTDILLSVVFNLLLFRVPWHTSTSMLVTFVSEKCSDTQHNYNKYEAQNNDPECCVLDWFMTESNDMRTNGAEPEQQRYFRTTQILIDSFSVFIVLLFPSLKILRC
jgi:hypothetical protein